jgi:hypothetical protein
VKASLGLVEEGREVGGANSTLVPLAGRVSGAPLSKAAENQLVEFFVAHSDGTVAARGRAGPSRTPVITDRALTRPTNPRRLLRRRAVGLRRLVGITAPPREAECLAAAALVVGVE